MKRRFFCGMLALFLMLPAMGGRAAQQVMGTSIQENEPLTVEIDWPTELIRLHILANDDSVEAQALKLQVRDACLIQAQAMLADCESAEDACALLEENLSALEAVAQSVLTEAGCAMDVHAEMGVFEFPDREYGGVLVPAGEYRALRIVIGEGQGQNWWCVLYPSLCMASEEGYYSIIGEWLQWLLGDGWWTRQTTENVN